MRGVDIANCIMCESMGAGQLRYEGNAAFFNSSSIAITSVPNPHARGPLKENGMIMQDTYIPIDN